MDYNDTGQNNNILSSITIEPKNEFSIIYSKAYMNPNYCTFCKNLLVIPDQSNDSGNKIPICTAKKLNFFKKSYPNSTENFHRPSECPILGKDLDED